MSAPGAATISDVRDYWNHHIHDLEISTQRRARRASSPISISITSRSCTICCGWSNFDGWRGKRVLDVGCGAGTELVRFARGGALVSGVDLVGVGDRAGAAELRAAAACGPICARPTASTCRFPTPRSISCSRTASCSTRRTAPRWSTECRRVLKPGGEAVFQVYNRVSWLNALSKVMKVPLEHEDAPVLPKLLRRASSARCSTGFRDVRIVAERFPVKSRLHGGWKGTAVQRLLRRHVQRPAARAGPPLRLAPPGLLPQVRADQDARVRQRLPAGRERRRPGRRIAPALTRAVCDRHRGIGADGLIVYTPTDGGARCALLNADGSYSEVSGNGVRCLAAWLASRRRPGPGEIVDRDRGRSQAADTARASGARLYVPRARWAARLIDARDARRGGEQVAAVTLRVGNPQCVVLGAVTEERLHSTAAALAVHPFFPAGHERRTGGSAERRTASGS